MSFPFIRPRRLRQTATIRNLVRETHFEVNNLIYPLFVIDGENQKQIINSLPDCFRFSIDLLIEEVKEAYSLGLRIFALFPVISDSLKAERPSEAYNLQGLIPNAIRALKKALPSDICLIADVALDPYTIHGHDGIADENGQIINDETVEILGQMALCLAKAGADIIAPSDMMDGRIGYIRKILEENNLSNILILSYAAKFASAFYAPFREALNVSLKFGDKATYQLDPANAREAHKEIVLDINEGADLIMVKPALAYLDIIQQASQISHLPIIVYSVSGEYAMLKAAAAQNWLDEKKTVLETMIAFRRAGAAGIITYYAKQIAQWLA